MTVRRKDDGTTSILSWGLKESSYRAAVLCLVLSMHPLGRQVLGTFGFKFPDEQKVTEVASKADGAREEIRAIAETVAGLKTDMTQLKIDSTNTSQKVDRLEQTFHGFEINFNTKATVPQVEK